MRTFEKLKEAGFIIKERVIGGELCYLVFPAHIGVKWTTETLIYRSSIWTADHRPVSLGFKKFFNYGEAPHLVPDFTDEDLYNQADVVQKLDGSCLLVSKFNGELIVRTRGTFDAREHDNGAEIQVLMGRYPKVFDNDWINKEGDTLIFEWTTRSQRIVIDYGAGPDIRLIGIVFLKDYTYMRQSTLPVIGNILGVDVPKTLYEYTSVGALVTATKNLTGEEGYCVYYNEGQDIKKIKSDWYLAAHRFRSNCSIEYILDIFLSCGRPAYDPFVESLKATFDFECAPEAIQYARTVVNANDLANVVIREINETVDDLDGKTREGRSLAAKVFTHTYLPDWPWKMKLAFTLLDGKALSDKQLKELITQLL